MKRNRWWRVLAMASAVGVAAAACGSDDGGRPLSHATASELRAGLDSVKQDVDAGDCQAATDSALELEQRTADLPSRLDSDLRTALQQGVARLGDLVREHCAAPIDEGTTGPTPPPTPGPTDTETTPPDEGKKNDKQEKPPKPGKGKKEDENGGTTGPTSESPPSDGGLGQDFGTGNQDTGSTGQ